jgi:hypothetical protein
MLICHLSGVGLGHVALVAILVFLNPTTDGISIQWVDASALGRPLSVGPGYLGVVPLFETDSRMHVMSQNPGGDDLARVQEINLVLDQVTKFRIEKTLTALGYDCGEIDGSFDVKTRSAIRDFQKEWSFPETGFIDDVTFVRLLAIGIF